LDGELIWSNNLFGLWDIYSIKPTDDFGYILSGNRMYGVGYQDNMIAKIDTTGNTLWFKWCAGPGMGYMDNFQSILVAYDYGYITCGYTKYNSETRLRILKTYPDPNVVTYVSNIPKRNEIHLYPNPTKGIFAISVKEIEKAEVYNISGEKILDIKNNDLNFDLSGHSQGIYIVRILYQGKTFIEKIILQ